MKTLQESLLGNMDNQVEELSDTVAIDTWIEKYIGSNIDYTINNDGSVTFNQPVNLLDVGSMPSIPNIPFRIKEVKGAFTCSLSRLEDYSNLPEYCEYLEIRLYPITCIENKTFEIRGNCNYHSAIIYGSTPKKFKNVTFKYTGPQHSTRSTIEFVSLSDRILKGLWLDGFERVELRCEYTKLSAEKINKYKDHFKDVFAITPQYTGNRSVRVARSNAEEDFHAEVYNTNLRSWQRF